MAQQPLSPLAQKLFQAHKARPNGQMYGTQNIIDNNNVADMDAAYEELVAAGLVRHADSGIVAVKGEPRKVFELPD